MSEITQESLKTGLKQLLAEFRDPYLHEDLETLGVLSSVGQKDKLWEVTLKFAYPMKQLGVGLAQMLTSRIQEIMDSEQVVIHITWAIEAVPRHNTIPALSGVKNIIAVASGKGGVGKSTTSCNLALALAREGARVGVLDADIYGPSQAIMLGVAPGSRPGTVGEKFFLPIEAHGLQSMSMGYLIDEKTPMVWRGPMVSSALQQMLYQTQWDDLDFLIIDLPPGTGDIQLTLAQKVPVTGAVIVTTPQDIALLDAKKAIEMFQKVKVPVVGVVENMSLHQCSQCGHTEAIFGDGGGERLCEDYQTQLLGTLPLDIQIRQDADGGTPSVISDPDGLIAGHYVEIARRLAAGLIQQAQTGNAKVNIMMTDD